MLRQLVKHRWICYVQGGLTLLFGACLLYLKTIMFGPLATTLICAFALLGGGFLLIAAGMLDLAVAVGISTRMHSIRSALLWWMAGMLGVSTGLVLLFAPQFSIELLAYFAAAHACIAAAVDFCCLPSLRRHALYRSLMFASALVFLVFATVLLLSAFSNDGLAMPIVGAYAVYFGVRMIWLGGRLLHFNPVRRVRAQRIQVHANL